MLSLSAQVRKLADPCTKQIPSSFLQRLFLPLFSLSIFFILFVFQIFSVLFTELYCHSNRSNYRLVQWSSAMLNRYLCTGTCACAKESVCIHSLLLDVYFCILCALVWLHMFFMPLFVIPNALGSWWLPSLRCWLIVRNVVLFFPECHEMSPVLKCKRISSLQVKIK